MTKDEALKLALKTLEQIQEGCSNVIADKLHSDAVDLAKLVRKDCNKPIDAIREALAQPEQESDDLTAAYLSGVYDGKNKNAPQRKPLTDEQWQEIAAITGCLRIEKLGRDAILRVLEEAAHGIKE